MHIQRTIEIRTRPEALWKLLTDAEQVKRWIPELVSDEPVTPGPDRVGSVSRLKVREGSRIVDYTSEITVYEPTTHFEIELKAGSLGAKPMRVSYEIKDDPTLLRYTARWRPSGIMLRLMHPLIAVMARRNTRVTLQRIKAIAEEENGN